MGVKKSTVCTRAISSVNLYTPASSAVDVSTRTFGSCCGGSSARACPNTVGLIFEAQPAQATRLVSFHCFCFRNMPLSLLYMGSDMHVPYCSASCTILPAVFHCVRIPIRLRWREQIFATIPDDIDAVWAATPEPQSLAAREEDA